jgi:exportin-2 (importin alpha re-exporter)
MCVGVSHLCKSDPSLVSSFENALMPSFQSMLMLETCLEFRPYVFQILSQLLELRRAGTELPPLFEGMFEALLHPTVWEQSGNIPALVRLLVAYLSKKHTIVAAGTRLTGMLGVFQKLLGRKTTVVNAMDLLTGIFFYIPL